MKTGLQILARRCLGLTTLILLSVLVHTPGAAAPVSVRFPEGVTHGFLLVRSLAGEILGHGEMTQVLTEGALVESQLVFHFKDGSLHNEKVAFAQQRVFTMISYHLIQRGPSFPDQIEISIERGTKEYTVRSQAGKEGEEELQAGQIDLPKDVYNGMLITILKNLQKGTDEMVNVLAFTPAPEVINMHLRVIDHHPVDIGERSITAIQYVLEPQIGPIREWFGKAIGKLPPQFHYTCWIIVDAAPAFVQFEGPLQLMGQIVRIELVSPQLRAQPEDKKISPQ